MSLKITAHTNIKVDIECKSRGDYSAALLDSEEYNKRQENASHQEEVRYDGTKV